MTITDEMIYACAAEARTIWLATLPVKGDLPVRQPSPFPGAWNACCGSNG